MNEKYIDEQTAMHVLCKVGDYSPDQARIILGHSLKKIFNGATHYPQRYIHERARPSCD